MANKVVYDLYLDVSYNIKVFVLHFPTSDLNFPTDKYNISGNFYSQLVLVILVKELGS